MGSYTTVLRGPSAAIFLPEAGFEHHLEGPSTRIRMRTRWRDVGIDHPLPEQLWIECSGEGTDFDEALRRHDAIAHSVGFFLSYIANASLGPLEVELVFETTPGVSERPFRQTFIREEPISPKGGRLVPVDRFSTCFNSWLAAMPNDRLNRALFQYSLALRSWRTGTEFQALDHLWIAGENIATVHLRRRQGEASREEFAASVGIDTNALRWGNELDAWARRDLVFGGDQPTYSAAKSASDGYEHGFMTLNDVQQSAITATDAAFGHVRRAIGDLLDVTSDVRSWLLALKPLDVASTRKILRGALVGAVEDPSALAHPAHEYPILKWRSRVKSFKREGDSFDAEFTESFTGIAGPGVDIQGHGIEVRGRLHPGDEVRIEEARVERSIDLTSPALGDILDFLDRCIPALSRILVAEVEVPRKRSLVLGLLGHSIAHAESVRTLVRDRRAVEALEIAARLYEWSTLIRWLADHDDRADAWLKWWMEASNTDADDLQLAEIDVGRGNPDTRVSQQTHSQPPNEDVGWPPTSSWLRTQAEATGRQRSWWLWRLSQSVRSTVLAVEARLVGDPGSMMRLATQETDLDELLEVGALGVESLAIAEDGACRLLGLAVPDQVGPCLEEAHRVYMALPRAANFDP